MIAPHFAPHYSPHPISVPHVTPHTEPHPLVSPMHPLYWSVHHYTPVPVPTNVEREDVEGDDSGLCALVIAGIAALAIAAVMWVCLKDQR